jgi:hypothetical protein
LSVKHPFESSKDALFLLYTRNRAEDDDYQRLQEVITRANKKRGKRGDRKSAGDMGRDGGEGRGADGQDERLVRVFVRICETLHTRIE